MGRNWTKRQGRSRKRRTAAHAASLSHRPHLTTYSSEAGAGSATFAQSGAMSWRAALLGTVAAGALLFGYGRSARADCVGAGTTLNCTGDLAGTDVVNGGIDVNGANYDTLNVYNLNAPITPNTYTDGISFFRSVANVGDITIDAQTDITTAGTNAEGIITYSYAYTNDASSATAGEVMVTQTGDIGTAGFGAQGIQAYSVANAQTNSGNAEAGEVTVTQTGDITTTGRLSAGITAVSTARYSSSNTTADEVTVIQTGDITTAGDDSFGIYAGSLARTIAGGTVMTDNVTVTQTGDITTAGSEADGIFALSRATASVSGDAYSADVTVTQTGDITTAGDDAYGIYAYSRATTSGSGNATAGEVTVIQTGDITIADENADGIYAGSRASASGGDATAAEVTVTQTGGITTADEDAEGIKAYSFASTTGSGDAYADEVMVTQTGDITTAGGGAHGIRAYSFALKSGAGGGNATADAVTVTQTGDITTGGEEAYGIFAYSNARTSDGGNAIAGEVTVTQTGDIATAGDDAVGIYAFSRATASGGGNATADEVEVTQTGDITTAGEDAYGILAYSYARANGSGNATADEVEVTQTGDITTAEEDLGFGIYAYSRAFASGGGNAYADDVTVTQTGDITTAGDEADGIFAFSVASATGGAAGTPGEVTVTQTGDITTAGSEAHGIYAFSRATSSGGNNAIADDVTVTQTGDITTAGEDAYGIFAYSRASTSGGGNAIAGEVTVTQTGDIATAGDDAVGIYAYSRASTSGGGTETNGNIAITLNGGAINSAQAEGVEFARGDQNTLTVNNTVFVSGGGGAADILGGDFDETINNYYTLTTPGIIDLGGGENAFFNFGGATFNSGTSVILGAGNLFTNWGNLSPGGTGTIQTTDLTGNFTQNGGGLFTVDVDFPNTVGDLLNVSGTANLDGSVAVNLVNPQAVTQGSLGTPVTILTAGTLNNNGIQAIDTVLVDYDLLFPGGDIMQVGGTVNFVPAGLNQNQTSIATNIAGIQGAGGSAAFTPIVAALLTLPDLPSLQNALNQISPEAYLDTEIAALYAALDFSNNLFSCPVSQGQFAFIREGQCVWVEGGIRSIDQDRTFENFNFDEHTGNVSGGAQVALGGDWFLGGALGYEWGEFKTDTAVRSDVDRFSGGVALKYNPGPWLLAGAISGGGSWYDTTRHIGFPGFAATATSDHEVTHGSGQLRAAYLMESGAVYLKPQVDLNATYIELDSFTETGAGGANLNVAGTDDWVFSVSPAIELGAQMGDEHDLVMVRPFVRAGITALDDTNFQISSTFAAAPVAPFIIRNETDDITYDVSGGADFFAHGNASLRVAYDGKFGDDIEVHSGSVRGRLGF